MYWEFAILARKLGIVAVAVGLSNSRLLTSSPCMLLVLSIAFAAQVRRARRQHTADGLRGPFAHAPPPHTLTPPGRLKHNPYSSAPGRAPPIVAEHEAKVAEGDAAHATIAADMRAMIKANSRQGIRTQVRPAQTTWRREGGGTACVLM